MLLEHRQACGHNDFPGKLAHPGEQRFPNIQCELPLMQLQATPSHPVTGHQRRDQHLPLCSPREEAIDNDEVTPQPPL